MLLDLSKRAKFRVTGADAMRFLNGQLTNDFGALESGHAMYACALTVKGKLCADLHVTRLDDKIYLDCDHALREALAARLERYMIADDVALEEFETALGVVHIRHQRTGERTERRTAHAPAQRLRMNQLRSWRVPRGDGRCGTLAKCRHGAGQGIQRRGQIRIDETHEG